VNPSGKLVVSVFSGGRGSATITRELLRDPRVQLNVLVNAYDDGLSTGDLRELIPGMLGPSDFRKNFSYVLDLYSVHQFALERLIEYRLPNDFTLEQSRDLPGLARAGVSPSRHPPVLREMFEQLEPTVRAAIADYLQSFFDFYDGSSADFRFRDCSLGNLVFAGAYLRSHGNFNLAVESLGALLASKAKVINVTRGENRILVALKEDGEVLERESRIVGPQSAARIVELFLLDAPLDARALTELLPLTLAEKRDFLRVRERPVVLSDAAAQALRESDVVIYGPGTQFSSIFPSYKTQGIAEALRESPAQLKAMIINLDRDHDIQSFVATELVDTALQILGDPDNHGRLITHLLYSASAAQRPSGVPLGEEKVEEGAYQGIQVVVGDFENPARPGIHSGMAVVDAIREELERRLSLGHNELDIYIDLNERSLGMSDLLQEFLELPWNRQFSKVRLSVNHTTRPELKLPPYLEFRSLDEQSLFSEVEVLLRWLQSGGSQYLVTISGDGQYRLKDVLSNIGLLASTSFGAVFGSRNQSRRQFEKSISAAYGESKSLYWASWAGAFVSSAIFGARFQVILSDPLTGFRIFKRSALGRLREAIEHRRPSASMGVTRLLIENQIEIAEVPVSYRTYKGFTNPRWRFMRGLKNVSSAFF
jgi:2-phospho-L-lactate transferase/gluconeogenesis factor (CofD/UPF0052 family)